MPLYEYGCTKCEHTFEIIEKYEDRKEKQDCPKCGQKSGEYLDKTHAFTYSLKRSFSRMRHGQ
jgi:putative FmdB family regulatory protein